MNTDSVIRHIVAWLDDYAGRANTRGFIVGVSGGIDSAVSSALAARTGRPVMCVEMPIYQAASQVSRARHHIELLASNHANVSRVQVELTPVFDALLAALPSAGDEDQRLLTLANTRARLRMTTLYYFAGLNNDLVIGTGNKVEDYGVGFFTKYGDGGVDLSPIADLLKTEVYEIGRALGVASAILDAPPTDGLWGDDRTDEDQIGAGYPELEWAMTFNPADNTEAALSDRHKQVLAIYRRLNAANHHKTAPIPVCVIPDNVKRTGQKRPR